MPPILLAKHYILMVVIQLMDEKGKCMPKYGKKAQEKVHKALHEMKTGELQSGKSGKKVKSRKQAIAIGLSEAREAGGKVPKK